MALTASEANGHRLSRAKAERRSYLVRTDSMLEQLERLIEEGKAKQPPSDDLLDGIVKVAADQGLVWEVPATNQEAHDVVLALQWWPRKPRALRLQEELGERVEEDLDHLPLLGHFPKSPNGGRGA